MVKNRRWSHHWLAHPDRSPAIKAELESVFLLWKNDEDLAKFKSPLLPIMGWTCQENCMAGFEVSFFSTDNDCYRKRCRIAYWNFYICWSVISFDKSDIPAAVASTSPASGLSFSWIIICADVECCSKFKKDFIIIYILLIMGPGLHAVYSFSFAKSTSGQ